MSKTKYTEKQVIAAIDNAFCAGVRWAETYVSWFTPSVEDNEERYEKAVIESLKKATGT